MTKQLVLIFGGSGGIGRQLAATFLRSDYYVIISGKETEQLNTVYKDLIHISDNCEAMSCDISDTHAVLSLAEWVLENHGCPDILINCAGFATYRTFEESEWDEIEDLIQVNLMGPMRCVKAFLPAMIARHSGTIVNVSSIAGRVVLTPNGTYSTAKHAMVAWSQVLEHELTRFGIHVNVICPGRVETAFFDHETFRNRVPRAEAKFTISAEQVAKATQRAIAKNRFMTYVPWTFAPAIWLMNVIPWLTKPLLGHLIRSRLESHYQKIQQL